MGVLDSIRAKAHAALDRIPGKAGEVVRKANDALGRPLADEHELADRRAFDTKATAPAATAKPAKAAEGPSATAPAPVIVYHMDKTRRDAQKLTDILEANGIEFQIANIQEDAAAQYAIKRDSDGKRLPVVFVAGECLGGREELVNAASSGALKKKVFGA